MDDPAEKPVLVHGHQEGHAGLAGQGRGIGQQLVVVRHLLRPGKALQVGIHVHQQLTERRAFPGLGFTDNERHG